MSRKRVLVVDDEQYMRELIRIYLTEAGYELLEASDGHQALELVKKEPVDMILLDIMMPFKDGWAVCEEIRRFSQVPIIMLTAKDDTMDKVKGLRLGADDYLAKPFEEMELLARMEAIFRRASPKPGNHLEHKGIILDIEARQVFYRDQEIFLTPREYDLLYTFMKNQGRVLSREQLLDLAWGFDFAGDVRTVDSHVKKLREKLRKAGADADQLIKTVWGVGYKMV